MTKTSNGCHVSIVQTNASSTGKSSFDLADSSARGGGLMFPAGAIIFVCKLLVMNNYTGLRNGLHGGSQLVLLNRLVSVQLTLSDSAFCFAVCVLP